MSTINSNTETDDEVLIREFIGGDTASFNLLVRKYQKKVYWLIRKMVINHDDADDITQEVFLKLYSSLKKFRGDSKFFTYVYRIAVNYSLNHLKRSSKINNRKIDFKHVDALKNQLINYDYDEEKRKKLLEDAIDALPPQQRAVFNLRFYENLSYEDISKILDKSTGGMKANYFHAMKNIEKFLRDKKFTDVTEIKYNE